MMRYLLLAITVISLGVAELASADVAVEGTDQSSRIWTLGTITWIAGALASLPYWARLCYAAATTRPFYKPVIFCLFCSLLFCTFYTIGSLLESRSSQLVSPDPGRIASTSTLSDTIVDFTLFAVWIKEHIRIDISDLFSLFRVVEQLGGSFILILPFALCVGPILAFYNMNIKRRDFLRSAIIGCIAYVICLFMLDAIYFTYMGFTPYSRLYTCEFTTRKFLSITSNLTGGVIGGIAYALLAQAVLRRMGAAAGYTKLFDSDVSKWYGIAAALFVTYYTMYFFIGEYRTVTPIRGSFAWNDLMIDMRQRGSEPQFLATSDLITLR